MHIPEAIREGYYSQRRGGDKCALKLNRIAPGNDTGRGDRSFIGNLVTAISVEKRGHKSD